jgi:hypothetical protein
MFMEDKKRKRVSFTEAGGDHAASVAAGSASDTKIQEFEVYQETRVTYENISCPVCKGNFSSVSAYRNHLPCH